MKHNCTRHLLLAIFLAIAWFPANAQPTLVRNVVASGGGTGAAGAISIDYTIGEPMVQTFAAGGAMLTQGFHQPEVLPPVVPGGPAAQDFMLFPNPAATTAKVGFNLLTDANVVFMLVNTLGQVIYQDVKTYGPGKITIPIRVDHLASGIYTVIFKIQGQVFTEKLIVQ